MIAAITYDTSLQVGDVALIFRADGMEIRHNCPVINDTGKLTEEDGPSFVQALGCAVMMGSDDSQKYMMEAMRMLDELNFGQAPASMQ